MSAEQAAVELRSRFGIDEVPVAIALGSGWAGAAAGLGEVVGEVPLAELTGFRAPTVPGHGTAVRLVRAPSGQIAALFTGRNHLYEGVGVAAAVQHVRLAAALGARVTVLTNGAASLRPDWGPGTIAVISDHLNLTGATPLVGPQFVDLTDAYDPRLRGLARGLEPALVEAVYCQFHGPAYETPAEVRMAARLGADLVGMSTAIETIAARALGMDVLALSLVTNHAAGIAKEPLSHAEVIAAGTNAEPGLRHLLQELLVQLTAEGTAA